MSERTPSCDCIQLTNDALAPLNSELSVMHTWSGERPPTVEIPTLLLEKRRGQKPRPVIPLYCPFCGIAYAWKDGAS